MASEDIDGVPEEDDGDASSEAATEEATSSVAPQDEDEDSKEEEDEDEPVGDIDQGEIDRTWIKGLGVNYPLKTYYKNLKKNLQIILNSERIPTRAYPKWSDNLFQTFKKLSSTVPEIQFVFQNLGLDRTNIIESAEAL